jgi:WD40 repeat protein
LQLGDGRLLTWAGSVGSNDTTARLWAADGAAGPVLQGHTGSISGALQLADGRLLTWSGDQTARLWAADGTPPGPVLRGHTDSLLGALQLADGRVLTWSDDKTARLWTADGAPGPVLQGHTRPVWGAMQLADGRLLTWDLDLTAPQEPGEPRLWPLEKGLLAWADKYIERQYPLSPLESCSYHLEPDVYCSALKAPSER